jgi:hypothetical protein
MITTVLDQALKLFGRGFLISAFVPSLLFVAVIVYLGWGIEALTTMVEEWTQAGLSEAVFGTLVALVAVYLLAYMLYGVRTALHQLYQGQWPIPLKWLDPIFMARQCSRMERLQTALEEKTRALDTSHWVQLDFEETFTPLECDPEDARSKVQEVRGAHCNLLNRLGQPDRWKKVEYADILNKTRVLQANRTRFSSDLTNEIDQLVIEIKQAYHAKVPLRLAAQSIEAVANREWTAAYAYRYNDLPGDESWLRPTLLGNISSVQELYPFERYGIYLSEIWPRLYHVLAKDVRRRLDEANIYLDFTVLASLLSIVAAVIACYSAFFTADDRVLLLRILLPVIFLSGAWLFYHLAIQAMRGLGVEVQSAVDLFRLKLLDALSIERPRTPADERKIWSEMQAFITQAIPPHVHIRLEASQANLPEEQE